MTQTVLETVESGEDVDVYVYDVYWDIYFEGGVTGRRTDGAYTSKTGFQLLLMMMSCTPLTSFTQSSATATGNVVVVTRVRQDVGHVLPPLPGTEDPADTYIFNRARPVVFGIVQIIVSLIILVLGIVMQQHTGTLVIHSGIFVWGPVMFFIAGFLTVAAGTSSSSSLIKSAMTFNTIAAVVSIVATVIYFLGVSAILTTDSSFPPFGNHDKDKDTMAMFAVSIISLFPGFDIIA
ncbi:high affinity immunoglobulin epsilon receptor subunit beta-like isoform X3 [Lates japonicus]|nr:high affinity immunoglobulin epsilon receptor subunit beta-like isoform X3 [Lates japonicus]